jgi:hypothetical protein
MPDVHPIIRKDSNIINYYFFIAIVINMELPTKIIPLNNADEAILHSGQIGTIRLSSGSGMVSYSPCRGGAGFGQIIILVDQPHIQACRTGLAVIAVHTGSLHLSGGKRTDDGIILLLCRGLHTTSSPV